MAIIRADKQTSMEMDQRMAEVMKSTREFLNTKKQTSENQTREQLKKNLQKK